LSFHSWLFLAKIIFFSLLSGEYLLIHHKGIKHLEKAGIENTTDVRTLV